MSLFPPSARRSELNACSWNLILKCFTKPSASVSVFKYIGQLWPVWRQVTVRIPSFLVGAHASITCEHAHLMWLLIVAPLLRYWGSTNFPKHQIYRGANAPQQLCPLYISCCSCARSPSCHQCPRFCNMTCAFYRNTQPNISPVIASSSFTCMPSIGTSAFLVCTNVTKWKHRWSLFILWQASNQPRTCCIAVSWINIQGVAILSRIWYGCKSYSVPSKGHFFVPKENNWI
jgi:hypothetical protein